MSHAIAIILARAGSKGLPGKNTAEVAGRPCICWTIDDVIAACDTGVIGRAAVSTDSPEAQSIARRAGLEVVSRPAEFASDAATIDDAARHAARALGADDASPIVILYANVPVRPPGLIERALDLLRRSGADSVQSVAPVGKHHPWWTARVEGDGRLAPWEGAVLNHNVYRRQDLPPAFIPDGGIIALTHRALMLEIAGVPAGPHAFFGSDRRAVVNRAGEVIDIDDRIDRLVADAVLRERAGGAAAEPGPMEAAPAGGRMSRA